MRAITINEAVVLNTQQLCRSYPGVSADAGGETAVEKIFIDVFGETRLLSEELNKIDASRAGCASAAANPKAQPAAVRLLPEAAVVAWPLCPARLGRVSSRLVGAGLHTHGELQVLPAQLKALQARKPDKQHARFAVVNGFGTNLGDNTVGMTAFRQVAVCLAAYFPSFSVDVLFGPDTSRANGDIVGFEPWVDQVFHHGPSLVDFAQYDAYFDTSGLIGLPKYGTMPLVDWYLWWFGLNPALIAPEHKRNQGHVRWDAWNKVHDLLRDMPGDKVLFNPKASVPLRSMPPSVAGRFALRLLALGETLQLVIDQPLDISHPRLLDLSGKIDSPEKFKALLAQMAGVVTVDTFALHWADATDTPSVTLLSSLEPGVFPYYPLNTGTGIEKFRSLAGYQKVKVGAQEWQTMEPTYHAAWESIEAKDILALLKRNMDLKRLKEPRSVGLAVVSERPTASCVAWVQGSAVLKRQRRTRAIEHSQVRLAELARSVLKPGARCVVAGAHSAALSLNLARQVQSLGAVHVFEPRQVVAQLIGGAVASAGVFNVALHCAVPLPSGKQAVLAALDPWSESFSSEWGNAQRSITVPVMSVDRLALEFCQLIIVQPPMPVVRVVKSALATLNKCRSVVIISPISLETARLVCKAAVAQNYTFWAEAALPGKEGSEWLLIGVPAERNLNISGFISIHADP